MTIKELAEFTGKDERTIQRWARKADDKMSVRINDKMSVSSPMYPADFTIDEVEEILNSGSMSKDAVSILMNNARNIEPQKQMIDYESLGKVIAIAVTAAMQPIIETMMNYNKNPEQLQIEQVPEKTPRTIFIEKMNEYCKLSGLSHPDAYYNVYTEIGYRYGIRVMARAKNRNCKGVDILESDGYLSKGISVILLMIKDLKEGV